MVDIDHLGQLIDSMEDAVNKLEIAVRKNKTTDANKLRTFIFDLHRQIENTLTGGQEHV